MLNNTNNQIKHIFLPILLKLSAFVVIYTTTNILLFHVFGLLDLNDDIPNLFIPIAIVPIFVFLILKQPFLVYEYKDREDNKRVASKMIIATLLTVVTCFTQVIATEKVSKIQNLNNINEIGNTDLAKYYTIKDFYYDKDLAFVTTNFKVTGQYNQNFQMDIYVAIPIFPSSDTTYQYRPLLYGLRYSKTIDNELSQFEKERQFQAFARDAQAKFDEVNLYDVSYFERLKSHSDKEFYLESYQPPIAKDKSNSIVLVPHKDTFEERLSGFYLWWFITVGVSTLVVFTITVTPNMNTERWRAFYHGKKLYSTENVNIFELILPQRGFFISPLLIVSNSLIFIIMAISSFSFISFDGQLLIEWGANYGPKIVGGEWWRLISNVFLHGGAMHLLFNLYALFLIGSILETTLKPLLFLSLYVISGLSASLVSLWWNSGALSIGASGAIFGMFGAYLSLLLAGSIPKEFKDFLPTIGALTVINIIIGLTVKNGIDNGAHIGGFLTGITLGLIISPFVSSPDEEYI